MAKNILSIEGTVMVFFGEDFITVTPGIRSSDLIVDQKRFSSAKEALRRGSDYIVVGRPITSSPNPVESVKSLLQEIKSWD